MRVSLPSKKKKKGEKELFSEVCHKILDRPQRSKISAKGHYKRRSQFKDDLLKPKQNP